MRAWPAVTLSLVALTAGCATSDPALDAAVADVKQHPGRARVALRPFAAQGNELAIAQICAAYGSSLDSEVGQPEREQAFAWCAHAARAGDVQSQYVLGSFYASGIGVGQDRTLALNWYLQAAGHGHREATDAARGLQGLPALCRNWITNCKMF